MWCEIGLHKWRYSLQKFNMRAMLTRPYIEVVDVLDSVPKYKNTINNIDINLSTRFCQRCYKKQYNKSPDYKINASLNSKMSLEFFHAFKGGASMKSEWCKTTSYSIDEKREINLKKILK